MSLQGQTLFITGASRGIGLAIALRAAADGANVAIAAKTAQDHPTLPGTIYTAAAEIEKAGGRALPLVCDIRFEDQIQDAVNKTVATFGGIDILVNNASAISLTGTLDTPIKKYDLMHQVNIRGTYVTSKLCLPHLMKGHNPHILNISPPLDMNSKWFKGHVAYTMAKYGMSMCVLGMAEEFADYGIAVNALWPRTGIATAAVKLISGGSESAFDTCRTPEIMADAAYEILVRDSTAVTGRFFVDDEILTGLKVPLDKYLCVPGTPTSHLMPDFFLESMDVRPEGALPATAHKIRPRGSAKVVVSPTAAAVSDGGEGTSSMSGPSKGPTTNFGLREKIFQTLASSVEAGGLPLSRQINRKIHLVVSGESWLVDLHDGKASVTKETPSSEADLTMTMDTGVLGDIMSGRTAPGLAWVQGKLKIKGDMAVATSFGTLFKGSTPRL